MKNIKFNIVHVVSKSISDSNIQIHTDINQRIEEAGKQKIGTKDNLDRMWTLSYRTLLHFIRFALTFKCVHLQFMEFTCCVSVEADSLTVPERCVFSPQFLQMCIFVPGLVLTKNLRYDESDREKNTMDHEYIL